MDLSEEWFQKIKESGYGSILIETKTIWMGKVKNSQIKPTKPNLSNQTYQTKPIKHTKLNLPNQTYQTFQTYQT